MLIRVVPCHPLTDSYNHALFQTITAALEDNGHGVAATDLYREHFDPVMNASERRSYYAGLYDDTVVCGHTELLRRVDGIIFCFPHWWFSIPAMLKGVSGDVSGDRLPASGFEVLRAIPGRAARW
jgi:NAD(P)H dehydrogenase (quinone)